MHATFLLLFKKLRLSEPWKYKAPMLITVPYFFFFAGNTPFLAAFSAILLSLSTGIGIAGMGYFINDLSDREADLKAGVPNGTQDLAGWQIALIIIFFLAAALLPWIFYFPVDGITLGLLAVEFILFILYSVPPFRLKDRGWAGVLADALYAHAVPALLGAYTYYLLTHRVYTPYALLLAAWTSWQLLFGLRSILQHQITDAANDRTAGSHTYVLKIGEPAAYNIMRRLLLPLESLAFILFTWIASTTIPNLFLAWPLYLLIVGFLFRFYWKQPLFTPLRERSHLYLDTYYLRWFPLVLLVALCLKDLRMTILLLAHLVLFTHGMTPLFKGSFRHFRTLMFKRN